MAIIRYDSRTDVHGMSNYSSKHNTNFQKDSRSHDVGCEVKYPHMYAHSRDQTLHTAARLRTAIVKQTSGSNINLTKPEALWTSMIESYSLGKHRKSLRRLYTRRIRK